MDKWSFPFRSLNLRTSCISTLSKDPHSQQGASNTFKDRMARRSNTPKYTKGLTLKSDICLKSRDLQQGWSSNLAMTSPFSTMVRFLPYRLNT